MPESTSRHATALRRSAHSTVCGQYPITAAVGRVSIVMTNPTTVFITSPEDSKDYSSTSKTPPDYTGFISGVKEDEPLIGG